MASTAPVNRTYAVLDNNAEFEPLAFCNVSYAPDGSQFVNMTACSPNVLNPFDIFIAVNQNHIRGWANVYFIGYATIGVSLALFANLIQRGQWKSPFFFFPLVTFCCACVYNTLDFNLAFMVMTPEAIRAFYTVEATLDAPSSICMDLAYWLRMRVLLDAQKKTGKLHPILDYGSYLLLYVPLLWLVTDLVNIFSLWLPDMIEWNQGNKFTGSFNIALAINETIMHFYFVYQIIKGISGAAKSKDICFLIATSVALSSMPLMLGAGAIVMFFQPIIGSYIMNSAWLSNVAVFLCLNRAIRKVVGKTGRPEQGSSTTPKTSKPSVVTVGSSTKTPD